MDKKILLPILGASAFMLLVSLGLVAHIWIFGTYDKEKAQVADLKAENMNALQAARQTEIVPVPQASSDDHLWGYLSAPAKLIAYMDYDCPFASRFFDTLVTAKKEFGDDLLVVVRHYPLASHADAEPAARAAECAGEQGKFWDYAAVLFEEENLNHKSAADLDKYAEEVSLALDEFSDCMASSRFEEKIAEDKAEAKAAGMLGSPSSSLNGQAISGAYQLADFVDPAGDARPGLRQMIKNIID